MNAAESWFGLEQYLSVSDIPKLDEKSMLASSPFPVEF